MDLHDPFIQFGMNALIAVLLSLLTILVAIWIYRKQRVRKEISYGVISDAPIASIDEAVADKVELLVNNTPVKSARLLVMKVWNSGNWAVEPQDYYEPITLAFGGNSVISCDVLETEPEDLIDTKDIKTFMTLYLDHIEFPKILLNPKRSVSLNIITTGEKADVTAKGQITNGNIVYRSPDSNRPIIIDRRHFIFSLIILMSLFISFVIIYFISLAPINPMILLSVISSVVWIIIIGGLINGVISIFKRGIKIKW